MEPSGATPLVGVVELRPQKLYLRRGRVSTAAASREKWNFDKLEWILLHLFSFQRIRKRCRVRHEKDGLKRYEATRNKNILSGFVGGKGTLVAFASDKALAGGRGGSH